ncbi:MAG: tetratricopeptide repeat protein [Caldisericia bacterium]|nr:tetratricopeptide repeat protein [Caldisericia bacterium]
MDKELQSSIKVAERSPYRLSLKVIVSGSAMSQGDLDTSYKLLMECLTFLPGYLPAQRLMAVNRLLAKEYPLSLQEFDHLLLLNPSSKIGLFGTSLLLCLVGKENLAIESLLELSSDNTFREISNKLLSKLTSDDSTDSSKFQSSTSKIKLEHKKTAQDMLDDLGSGSKNIRLKLVLAGQLIDRGEKKTALGILTRLMDSYPNYPKLLALLAKMLVSNGETKSANSLLQSIMDFQPTFKFADDIAGELEYKYGSEEDLPALSELDSWCESLLIQFARQQIIPELPSSEHKNVQKIEPTKEKPTTEKSETVSLEPKEETKKPESATTEPSISIPESKKTDIENVEAHQLKRARNILEQARKILDQTKKIESQKSVKEETITETSQQPEKKPKVVEEITEEELPIIEFESTPAREDINISGDETVLTQEPKIETTEDFVPEEETIFEENIPQRVVLPTSEAENEYTEDSAWSLLKEGSAEEAFFIFSKLVRKFYSREDSADEF